METPIGTALVVCDQVITEAGTNKKTLVGTFNNLTANSVPCIHHRMSVFVSLTSGEGHMEVRLECKCMANAEVVFKAGTDISLEDPNHVAELIFVLGNVPFKNFGLHCLEVYAGDSLVLESRFNVVKKEQVEP